MLNGALRFFRGLFGMPLVAQVWVGWLVVVNGLLPFRYGATPEARATLAVFLAGALALFWLTGRYGFTRILGLGHFLWYPLLLWLALRVGRVPVETEFGWWLRALMATNAVSLAIDTVDVIRWRRGDRAELIEGLGPR